MGHAKTESPPSDGPSGGQRRAFFRVTTRLRYAFVAASEPPRPWLSLSSRPVAFFLQPPSEELARARDRLAAVPRRTITLSEGGMRVRFPAAGCERSVLAAGDPGGEGVAEVLLEVVVREEVALFRLPVRLLREDPYP